MTEELKPFRLSALFWDDQPQRLDALRFLAKAALGTKKKWASDLRGSLVKRTTTYNHRRLKEDQVTLWGPTVFRRFLVDTMPTAYHENISMIAATLFRQAAAAGPTREAYRRLLAEKHPDIRTEFGAYCDELCIDLGVWEWRNLSDETKVEIGAKEIEAKKLFPFFDQFVRATQLTETQGTVESAAFPEDLCANDQEFRRFLIYRNSINARRISKMYGFFRRARLAYPYPTFAVFYCDNNGRRAETTSIMLGAQQAVHLFGTMGSGIGLNLISISRSALTERSFAGLQLSTDSNGIPIASRLLFVETDLLSDDAAEIGIISRNKLAAEKLTRNQMALLSNRVGVERTDLTRNGESISFEETRDHVAERLLSAPILMEELGIPYNPADPRHIPFNTALHLK